MNRIITFVLFGLLGCTSIGLAQSTTNRSTLQEQEQMIREIQQSHIEGNVPPKEEFQELLTRDVHQYIRQTETNDFKIEFELLRDGPTQTGIAFPKFYLWLKIDGTNGPLTEGAMCVAAIQKQRFEVKNFISKSEIVANPASIDGIFPKALCPIIRNKAGLKD